MDIPNDMKDRVFNYLKDSIYTYLESNIVRVFSELTLPAILSWAEGGFPDGSFSVLV
jgi:hypothetical protein